MTRGARARLARLERSRFNPETFARAVHDAQHAIERGEPLAPGAAGELARQFAEAVREIEFVRGAFPPHPDLLNRSATPPSALRGGSA